MAVPGMVLVESASLSGRLGDRVHYSSLLAPSFDDTHSNCLSSHQNGQTTRRRIVTGTLNPEHPPRTTSPCQYCHVVRSQGRLQLTRVMVNTKQCGRNTPRIHVPFLSRGQASLPCAGLGEGGYAERFQLCSRESPSNLEYSQHLLCASDLALVD